MARDLAGRNIAAMESFRGSLANVRAARDRQAADLAERRRLELATGDAKEARRAQMITALIGALGGAAQTGIGAWSRLEEQKRGIAADAEAADLLNTQRLKAADRLREWEGDLASAAATEAATQAALDHEREMERLKKEYEYNKALKHWASVWAEEAARAASERSQGLQAGAPTQLEVVPTRDYDALREKVFGQDVQAGWEGVVPLLRYVPGSDNRTENYEGFMVEGDTLEDGQRKWQVAAQERTPAAFWSVVNDLVKERPGILNDSGAVTESDVHTWNEIYLNSNWVAAESLLGDNSYLVALRNEIYGQPIAPKEPSAVTVDPDTVQRERSAWWSVPSFFGGRRGAGTSAAREADDDVTTLDADEMELAVMPPSLPAPIPERADVANTRLNQAATARGALSNRERALVPKLRQFIRELQGAELAQYGEGGEFTEEYKEDWNLANHWAQLEAWIGEIEQQGESFTNVPDQHGNLRSGRYPVWPKAIGRQLQRRLDDLAAAMSGAGGRSGRRYGPSSS